MQRGQIDQISFQTQTIWTKIAREGGQKSPLVKLLSWVSVRPLEVLTLRLYCVSIAVWIFWTVWDSFVNCLFLYSFTPELSYMKMDKIFVFNHSFGIYIVVIKKFRNIHIILISHFPDILYTIQQWDIWIGKITENPEKKLMGLYFPNSFFDKIISKKITGIR